MQAAYGPAQLGRKILEIHQELPGRIHIVLIASRSASDRPGQVRCQPALPQENPDDARRGVPGAPTGASAGSWTESGYGLLAILPYEAVRAARTPKTMLLAFCQSAYEAGARLAGWDTTSFESTWCPIPD